jgi:hypothetical protein
LCDEPAGKGVDGKQRREFVDRAARGAERRLHLFLRAGMRSLAVEQRANHAECGIAIEHPAERSELRAAGCDQKIRQRGRERSGGGAERADQAVARKDVRAPLVGGGARQHRMLQRHGDAEIAAGGIDGADEGGERDQHKMLDIGECESRGRHQAGAKQQQCAQVEMRRDPADDERQQCGAEQRGGGDNADGGRTEAEHGQVGRQDDDGKAVAKTAQRACGIEQRNQRGAGRRFRLSGYARVHAQSSTPGVVRRAWTERPSDGEPACPRE